MASLEIQLSEYEIEIFEYQRERENYINNLVQKIDDLDVDIVIAQNASQQENNAMSTIEILKSDLIHAETTMIYGGTTTELLEKKHDAIITQKKHLKKIVAEYSEIRAEYDGTIIKVNVKQHDEYLGIDELCTIRRSNSIATLQVKLDSEYAQIIRDDDQCEITYVDRTRGTVSIPAILTISGRTDDGAIATIVPIDDSVPSDAQKITASVTRHSAEYETIIPNSAFISPDAVYIMKTRKGFWGEEAYAQLVPIKTGEGDTQKTSILAGLKKGDSVIISWDRQITDGVAVTLPYD